jgi:single-strand DNA-binding protein
MDLNKVMLIGRLTQDPEVKQLPSGQSVCSNAVATGRRWKNQAGELQEKTEFNNVVFWRKLAEIVGQYCKKGSKLYIEGHLETRSWEAQDGTKRYRTEIVADNMIMLDSKGDSGSSSSFDSPASSQPAMAEDTPPPSEDDLKIDEIPF